MTIDANLLDRVDHLVARRRFRNRSQAVETALAEKLARLARTPSPRNPPNSTRLKNGDWRTKDSRPQGTHGPNTEGRDPVGLTINPARSHETSGERRDLILSHDVFNDRSGTVIAVALTSRSTEGGLSVALSGAQCSSRLSGSSSFSGLMIICQVRSAFDALGRSIPVVAEIAVATVDHSDIRGSEPHNRLSRRFCCLGATSD